MELSRDILLDKITGCWMGKSVGGTLGTPFEGRRELLDIPGLTSAPGRPLPNDDLDLQLVWLQALERYGPLGINEQLLGEHWLNYITPHWNEYGTAKANMRAGLPPPLSGSFDNVWQHSNGAWIRSEIWACTVPGRPDLAARYAWFDACVDHGTGEGTWAELFTAAVEAAAFAGADTRQLIDIGLSYIPDGCRIARSVRLVMACHDDGLDWKQAREQVLQDSSDLGWFQAPANVGYMVIGWLYGEGDFKKSLTIAVNCGDDTDCTAATLGAILGIIGGRAAIPADWAAHVGDDIVTVAIDRGSMPALPQTCTELARRTLALAEQAMAMHRAGAAGIPAPDPESLVATPAHAAWLARLDGAVSFDFIHTEARLLYKTGPQIAIGDVAELAITLRNKMPEPRFFTVDYLLPPGLVLVRGCRRVMLQRDSTNTSDETTFAVTLRAEGEAAPGSRAIIRMVGEGRPTVVLLPVVLLCT